MSRNDTNTSLLRRSTKYDKETILYGICRIPWIFQSSLFFLWKFIRPYVYRFLWIFANFIIAKISGDKADERYIENQKSAMAFTGKFAIIELFAIWCAVTAIRNGLFASLLLSLAYAITLNVYAIKLYMLEEK